MTKTPRDLLPLAPMVVAVVLFAAFHFLPVQKEWRELGWGIWPEVYDVLSAPARLDAMNGIGLASFLMFSVLIVSSPFLMPVWRKSKLALVLARVFSGLGMGGFWMMFLVEGDLERLASGAWCLMIAPVLNFMGLLLVFRENGPESPPESA